MKIAMFGGTFNPPHNGHIRAACACVNALALDRLILMPTAVPPHKALPKFSATSEQRLHMARLCEKLIPKCEVSSLEISRGGASYTADTLAELSRLYPDDELFIIMGTDMLKTLDSWYRPEKICALAKIAAVARHNGELDFLKKRAFELKEKLNADITVIKSEPVDISSTQVREGELADVPKSVAEYIKNECLYIDFDKLSEKAKSTLSEKRFLHTQGVAELAASLAEKYGESVNCAYCAGLLHDITKELPLSEQIEFAKSHGIVYDYDEENIKELIHADTAAAVAQKLGICEKVVSAVKYHTTGKENMSLLEKIVFVADACEKNRKWSDAPYLRELAMRDIDEASIFLAENTIKRLENLGKKPYYRTVDALLYLKAHRKDGKNE